MTSTVRRAAPVAAIAVVALVLAPVAGARAPSTVRASLSATGAQLNDYNAVPAVSADGRWVAFDSYATNVVPGAHNTRDVYLRDMHSGTVERIPRTAAGAKANGSSATPSISADGRYVAFTSWATNLARGATNADPDVFVFDRVRGTVKRLSTSVSGGDGAGPSIDPEISPDGTHVVFQSAAGDLVAGDAGHQDVFIADVATGRLRRVASGLGGTAPDGGSYFPDVSDGGRYVSFASEASNLVAGDTNGTQDTFVRDMASGRIERVSVSASGGEANSWSTYPEITAGGCHVAFVSAAANLVVGGDTPPGLKVYVRDRCRGNTEAASVANAGGIGTVALRPPAISDDGCAVAFVTDGVVVPAPGVWAAVLRDRCQGFTSRLDVATTGEAGDIGVESLRMSAGSGRYVAFDSGSTNLVPGDSNGTFDAFVRDRANAAPPLADLRVTVQGRRVTVDASRSNDPDNRIESARITFGDGSPDHSGLTAAYDYARPGTFTVTLTVVDGDGLTAIASRNVTIPDDGGSETIPGPGLVGGGPADEPRRELRLTAASLSRSRFAPVRRRAGGAYLRVTASEAATLRLVFERAVRGRRAGNRCRTGAARGRRCTLHRRAGTVTTTVRAGDNRVRLDGRVGRRVLKPGRYRLRVVGETADGRSSNPLVFTLTIRKG